jgi:hypothetical protein
MKNVPATPASGRGSGRMNTIQSALWCRFVRPVPARVNPRPPLDRLRPPPRACASRTVCRGPGCLAGRGTPTVQVFSAEYGHANPMLTPQNEDCRGHRRLRARRRPRQSRFYAPYCTMSWPHFVEIRSEFCRVLRCFDKLSNRRLGGRNFSAETSGGGRRRKTF